MDRGNSPHRILLILILLASGAAVAFAALWIGSREVSPEEVTSALAAEDAAVETVAVGVIQALLDYDSGSLDAQREKLLRLSTGSFRDQYEELLAGELQDVLEKTSASSKGDIADGPYVGFETASRATAVARVVQEVSTRTSENRNIFYVMRLTLILAGDGWKADSLQILSQQSL